MPRPTTKSSAVLAHNTSGNHQPTGSGWPLVSRSKKVIGGNTSALALSGPPRKRQA
jgi:hypothetical protein